MNGEPSTAEKRHALARAEAASWAAIPWMRPALRIGGAPPTAEIVGLVDKWRARITPYAFAARKALPEGIRIVTEGKDHVTADTTEGDAITRLAENASEAALTSCEAHAGAELILADATYGIACVAATAADSLALAAIEAFTGPDAEVRSFRGWWDGRPYLVLRRHVRWILSSLPAERNPFAPPVEIYRLGCMPMGYSRGEFVIYAPSPSLSAKP